MREFLKTCRVELQTRSPLFIGDGRKLGKKEYFRRGDFLYVPDMQKMAQGLSKKRLLSDYEDYVLGDQREDLRRWLESKGVFWKEMESWTAYKMNTGDIASGRKLSMLDTFIKDPYGCPYIPGSSLKGALRTILLVYMIHKERDRFEQSRRTIREKAVSSNDNRKYYLKSETQRLEAEAFHRLNRLAEKPDDFYNAVNDIMSGIRISDSAPLHTEDLVMCEKMDMSTGGQFKMPVVARECIQPGTKVEFTLTLDECFPYSVEQITEAIKLFATDYLNCFYKFFYKKNPDLQPPRVNYIWLGGGVGYVSKTVVYNLLNREDRLNTVAKIMQKTVRDTRHGHDHDEEKGVSPHMLKCTKYKGKFYELGQCALKICETT